MLHSNLTVGSNGHLFFNGADTISLAEKYGTPLYLLDTDRVRERCRLYRETMKEAFTPDSEPLYASKALSVKGVYRICREEGISADVVSCGEIYTAVQAGFPAEKLYFHGNAKTGEDLDYALGQGVGFFVVDNETELRRLNEKAGDRGVRQKILLRLTPGVDPHTFEAVNTGKIDSKFGAAIATGQAESLFVCAQKCCNLSVMGVHCHIGSQIFDVKPFCDAVDMVITFLNHIKEKYSFVAEIVNLGGGIGIRYREEDPVIDIRETILHIGSFLKRKCCELSYPMPMVLMEPGRSIVADAGLTLYTVQNVKVIPEFKQYVAIDGGMADNPRYALYRSRLTALIADRAGEPPVFQCTVAGRCCESGDLIGEEMFIQTPRVGDRLAVLVTGAYNFSMSSHYNALPTPPIVAVSGGADSILVRRESLEDLTIRQE